METSLEKLGVFTDTASLTEPEQIKRGERIEELLMLKKKSDSDRYNTTWGYKTPLGLFLTVKRIIEQGE